MTDNTNETETKSKQPTHTLYTNTYVDNTPKLVRVGVAWKHSKGEGFNIALNDMVAFANKDKAETNTAQSPKDQPKP